MTRMNLARRLPRIFWNARRGRFTSMFIVPGLIMLGVAVWLFGVMAAGEPGARRALEILASELERTMKLCGVRSMAEIGPELLSGS